MGLLVGSLVGSTERVGRSLGMTDSIGVVLGLRLGAKVVGLTLGVTEGKRIGVEDGLMEGTAVGYSLASWDGSLLVLDDGEDVGPFAGNGLGTLVGILRSKESTLSHRRDGSSSSPLPHFSMPPVTLPKTRLNRDRSK